MLSTIIISPLSLTTTDEVPSSSSTKAVAEYFSSKTTSACLSVNDIILHEPTNISYRVIETSPVIRNGKVNKDETQWIVLPHSSLLLQDDKTHQVCEKLQQVYERSLFINDDSEEDNDEEDESTSNNQALLAPNGSSPSLFVLGDYYSEQEDGEQSRNQVLPRSQMTLINTANISTFASVLLSQSQNKSVARKLGSQLVSLANQISSSSSSSCLLDDNQHQHSIFVTPTTLQHLHLRHQSKITFQQEDHSTQFTLNMIDDNVVGDGYCNIYDAFAGVVSLLQESDKRNDDDEDEISTTTTCCLGFIHSPVVFTNLKNHIEDAQKKNTAFAIHNLSVKSVPVVAIYHNNNNNNNNTDDDNADTSSNSSRDSVSSSPVLNNASSLILRPITRNIVTDSIDTTQILQLRRESHLVKKKLAVRAGDIIELPRRDDLHDVNDNDLSAAPLSTSCESLSKPMNPASSFCPQSQECVFFYVEKVEGDYNVKNKNNQNQQEAEEDPLFIVTASTALIEGAPISSSNLELPSSVSSRYNQSLLPFSSTAFSRTKTFQSILKTCQHLYSPSSSSSSSHFALSIFSSSSSKTATLPQLQIILSSLGLYFEVVQPGVVGMENLKSLSNLVCNASSSSGVLILYCADSTLFEHSEVVQWLVASCKQQLPLRVILVSESGDSSKGALSVLNTVATVPTLNLDEVAAEEDERRVFVEDLISSLNSSRSSSCSQEASSSFLFSRFLDFTTLAEASAGLFFLELYQWIVQSITKSQQQQHSTTTSSPLLIDQEFLITNLDKFKKDHGHNVTSTKLQEVRWADVGGLEEQRDEIMTVLRPPAYLANSNAKRRTGVLLFGPPGCGKTLLAKVIATECGMNFLSVKGPELLNMYVGQSEKNIRDTFKKAREAAPCIVFFDELDALAPARGAKGDSGGVMDRIVAQLLVELDGAASQISGDQDDDDDDEESEQKRAAKIKEREKKMVFIIGATNRPDLLDPALLRPGRFDRMSYVGMAETKENQLAAVRALTRKFVMSEDISFENGNLKKFLDENDVPCIYTGADYYGFCADAMTMAVSEAVNELVEKKKKNKHDDDDSENNNDKKNNNKTGFIVTKRHFEDALKNVSPSVPMSELQKYQQLRKQYAVKN